MTNNPLVDALAPLNLEPGRTYRCQVNGRQVVVRVQEDIPAAMLPAPLVESDIMLDPWVELPAPEPMFEVRVTPGQLPPPDLPEMLPAPLVESDIMLDAWVELPEPMEGMVTISRLGDPDLPNAPVIPDEEAGQ